MAMVAGSLPGDGNKGRVLIGIEEDYPIGIKNILKIAEDRYEADSLSGPVIIERAGKCENRLIFICGLYDYLRESGFNGFVKPFRTKSGGYYSPAEDGLYMVVPYTDRKIDAVVNEEDIIGLIAHFHRCTEGYTPPVGGKCKSCWGKWIDIYRRELRELKKIKEYAELRNEKSPFDKLFLKSCDRYLYNMEAAIQILKRKGYLDSVEESMKKRQVCLHEIKQSNFCYRRSEIYIKSLTECRYDIVESDIALFFMEMVKKNENISSIRINSMLNKYTKINSLGPNSIDIMKAFISYPERYVKVCLKYYGKKNRKSEDAYIRKLHSSINHEQAKDKLAGALDCIDFD
jgi:spore coat protein, CotS family